MAESKTVEKLMVARSKSAGVRSRRREPDKPSPTPDEIRLACLEIQQDWTDGTYYKRAGLNAEHWSPPGCKTPR